jgi:hypothetical protein
MNRSHRTSAEMYPLIEAYYGSGQSQRAFCAEHGLGVAVFGYWRGKYRQDHAAPVSGFLEIQPETAPTEKAHVEILYQGGVRVRLFSAVTPAYVRSLIPEVSR